MDVFDAVADPVRRRIVVLLGDGPRTAGALAAAFPDISRPAVSRHLRVLREAGLVTAELVGRERHYRAELGALAEIDRWLATVRGQLWDRRLDALETEVHRARRDRRARPETEGPAENSRSAG
ncbi:ArsR family transcriptional regulator [Actinomadura pelletieri DSM 43383]|uniref:ArsR family transcriptional regulator n=1 Tax=Actinomadura pelletieri DSM 43383 TaxID=1120940 RepID=A0A495QJN9_9ACTN|nr:metalloregulator ArsR/SmtB family transcription factor [Actinomadura pelletieri]RKS72276.1 ArsR family transcriptional regulator [Actinomadura pelletieri DSM 43383]